MALHIEMKRLQAREQELLEFNSKLAYENQDLKAKAKKAAAQPTSDG
jgi:hypothetical protein